MKVGLKIASVLFLFSIFSAAPARAASPAFVVVGYGDDLYRIAAQFGTRADELARANKLPSVNFVYVGQIIFIPETFTDTAALSSANAAAPIVQVYTVRYGDTLYALATRFGTTIQAVMNANGIRNPNFIYSGQRLNIPNKNNPSGTQISASSSTASSATSTTNLPVASANRAMNPVSDGKWIDIDISAQTITAYQGNTPLKKVLVSTGVAWHPTVLGRYAVYMKVPSQAMSGGSRFSGDYYYLPGVPNVMYFFQGYAIHGTYWHHNFGTPMSHGCVNLTLEDAKWFFDWAEVGTPVLVHL